MLGPDFLSEDLQQAASKAVNDQELFQILMGDPPSLVAFFETACEDPVWFRKHPLFIRQTLRFATRQFFLSRFPLYTAHQLGSIIRNHYGMLAPFLSFQPALFFTIHLQVVGERRLVNSFLFGTASPFFKKLFTSCFLACKDTWTLPVSLPIYLLIEEFVSKGSVQELWKLDEKELLELMKQANIWELKGLVQACCEMLKKFTHRGNVIDNIIESHRRNYLEWKKMCCEAFNQQGQGLRLHEPQSDHELKVEILDYKEGSREIFERLAPFITHLVFSGTLSLNRHYGEWIDMCPRLIGADLNGSDEYDNQFDDLPGSLQELNLSACSWLRPAQLKEAGYQFPGLKKLYLNSNPQLDYQAWGEFHRFKNLYVISLGGCHQISDEDLKLIGKSCTHLSEINLEDCSRITDQGMHELLLRNPHLIKLNCSRCENLTDKMLGELGIYTHQLTELNINYCPEINEGALRNYLRQHPMLQTLHMKGNALPLQALVKLKKDFSFLQVND
jgi:hypothetical protein